MSKTRNGYFDTVTFGAFCCTCEMFAPVETRKTPQAQGAKVSASIGTG